MSLLCWGGVFRTPFGWSLIEVDPLQFPNQGIPSAMSMHPVWLPFSSLGFQEEGLDLVASAPWKEGSGTPRKGKGLDLGLLQFHQKNRIDLIGNKERALIKDSDPDFIYHNSLKICSEECPAIIVTHNSLENIYLSLYIIS